MKLLDASTSGRGGRGVSRGGGRTRRGSADAAPLRPATDGPRGGKKQQGGAVAAASPPPPPRQAALRPARRDHRFAGRRADPVFQAGHQLPGDGAALSHEGGADPRFKRLLDRQARTREDSGDARPDNDDDDSIDEEEAAVLDEDAANWSGSDVDECPATRRIAVVHCDWDHIRASDLFAIFLNAVPLGGSIERVVVYMSDFGAERLAKERRFGPDLWEKQNTSGAATAKTRKKTIANKNDATVVDVESASGDGASLPAEDDAADDSSDDDRRVFHNDEEDAEKFSAGKYRQYELDRMKYYYAVCDFDSAETAALVNTECDGLELEGSGVLLDLRFVPDDETFDESRVRDRCTKLPRNFKPLKAFQTQACTNTKFKISWDRDDAIRQQSLRDMFTGESEEADIMAYLASDSDDEEEGVGATSVGSANVTAKRREKRRAIRSKYAGILATIGSSVEEPENEALKSGADGEGRASSEHKADDDVGSDDDDDGSDSDLNADLGDFGASDSDEEGGESDATDASDSDEEGEDSDGASDKDVKGEYVTGNMDSTLNLDAETKAQALQRNLQKQLLLAKADTATRLQHKYREQRKAGKKAKKESFELQQQLSSDVTTRNSDFERSQLESTFGSSLEAGRGPKRGKAKHKEMVKSAKAREAEERRQLKQRRVAAVIAEKSGHAAAPSTAPPTTCEAGPAAAGAPGPIDPRFRQRLVGDSRFHIDVTDDRHRKDRGLQRLAAAVVSTRRNAASDASPRGASMGTAAAVLGAPQQRTAPLATSAAGDDAVEYFTSRKRARSNHPTSK